MVSRIAAWRRRLAGGALALLIAGCAQLPVGVARPVTQALPTPDGTPLAALVQQRREAAIRNAAGRGNASGFILLPSPELAYDSRLALIEGATRTLDLQYYAIHADRSTTRLADGLRAAAARGVRVRILIDDFHSTGRDAQVLALALEPGIDIRLFNPLAGGRTSTLARALGSIDDASRIQQRMHNKLFIADNVLGVTGGRNLGDAYFGKGKKDNFVDLDVLAAGPIVQDMSRSFDRYWNNERAYPAQSLLTRAELESLRDDAVRDATAAKDAADPAAPDTARDRLPLDLKEAAFVWAPAVLLVDQPAKIAADTPGASSAPGLVVTRRAALGNASEAAAEGDTVVEGLLQLVGQAQRELLIISPYFVPGLDIKRAFAALTARGVRVRVLTNSLASNDAPIAHVGYARHRDELLAMGVQLYEMRGEGASLRSALGRSGGGGSTGDSRAMLHSKVLVMDRRLLAVGSMNLDLRSQLQNTEVALLIRSSELSGAATDVIETTLRDAAWHVERVDGQLTWRAPEGSGLKDTTTEPDASATLQLVLKLLGPLAPDSML